MTLEAELSQASPARQTVLTIGVFDGVHRGHRHLISTLTEEARRTGRLPVVVTFRNHPASVLRPGSAPLHLTTFEERVQLIHGLGVSLVVPVTFDLALSELHARGFIERLQGRLRMRGLVVGPDFAMGHRREGGVDALRVLGQEMGFSLSVVEPLFDDGLAVRSTSIRRAVASGDIATASRLLGRPMALTGTVVKGQGRGRDLGFPTANVEVPACLAIPRDGIYATWAEMGDGRHMAAVNVGTSPTFGEGKRTVEAFVLDFQGDLYQRRVRLEFVARLRDEVRYEAVEALVEQIGRDVEQVRSLLGRGPAGDE